MRCVVVALLLSVLMLPYQTAAAQTLPAPPLIQPAVVSEIDITSRITQSVVQVVTDEGQGSGVQIAEGIITNEHVVGDASQLTVIAPDGRRVPATVIRNDAALDLALVRADLSLPPVQLEPARQQPQGTTVLVYGYPRPDVLGQSPQVSVSRGLISAMRQTSEGATLIQTDAAINPGNSGGALINPRGNLIGVPSSRLNGGQGIGFAIGAETVASFLQEPPEAPLAAGGTYTADAQDVALTADDLGADWQVYADPEASDPSKLDSLDGRYYTNTLVFGDVNATRTGVNQIVAIAPDAQTAHRLWQRWRRSFALGYTRQSDPAAGDECRAYSQPGSAEQNIIMICRVDNVLVSVVGVISPTTGSGVDVQYCLAMIAQRIRDQAA